MREGAFTSPLHNRYVAAWLGYALGWSFLVCFVTGLISHWAQQPPGWFVLPTRPVWIYRATQGTHVVTGLACIPLLLAKLWAVYPQFWEWPPVRSIAHALERLSLLGLVGGSILQLLTGLANIYQWYFFSFFFTPTHYFTSWVVMGSLLVHIGTKITLARDALAHPDRYDVAPAPRRRSTALTLAMPPVLPPPPRRATGTDPTPADFDAHHRVIQVQPSPSWFGTESVDCLPRPRRAAWEPPRRIAPPPVLDPTPPPDVEPDRPPGLSRRWFLGTVGLSAAAVTVTTFGQTVTPLRALSPLAPRRLDTGGSRIPINNSARSAGVRTTAVAPGYRLSVMGRATRAVSLTVPELEALPVHQAQLPLTCVEGWSVGAHWAGVRLSDLVLLAGGSLDRPVRVESLEPQGLYRSSVIEPYQLRASSTLLATHLDGERLTLDHGYPVRLIAANRPGVLQTKWIERVVLL